MNKIFTFICLVVMLITLPGWVYAELTNGGFETGDLSGWATTGNAQVLASDTLPYGWQDDPDGGYFIINPETNILPYEGTYMLKIGSQTADENWADNNRVSQTVTGSVYRPELTFAFNMWSYDYNDFDRFTVGIEVGGEEHVVCEYNAAYVDTNGEPPVLDGSGWEFKTIDLSPWLGDGEDPFTIWFEAGDTGDTAMRTRTGAYVDAVRITDKPEPCEGEFRWRWRCGR